MSGFTCSVTNHCLMYIHVYIHVHVQITEFVLEILHLMDFRGTNAHPHTLFNKTVMCEKLMVGPDKPVVIHVCTSTNIQCTCTTDAYTCTCIHCTIMHMCAFYAMCTLLL